MYLNCHTGFSFKYGMLPVQALFEEAKRCGIHKLALTEINNTASYMDLLRICEENKPTANGLTKFGNAPYLLDIAVGIEFRRGNQLLYITLAKNNEGFEAINRMLSFHKRTEKPFPQRGPQHDHIFVIYPFGRIYPQHLHENEFIGVPAHELNTFTLYAPREGHDHKFVAWHPITLSPPELVNRDGKDKLVYRDHNAHRLLRCIDNNILLSKLPEHAQARKEEYMLTEQELKKQFGAFPYLIDQASALLNQCSIECKMGEDKNKKSFKSTREEDIAYLREETRKGYHARYGDNEKVWNENIEKELRIITQKAFTAYYLIAYDLISFAKRNDYDFVGRGSGANSTVAYCLGITNVDPIELNLYFERFLNEERTSPPDFDIDFAWDNRDAIYAYLFKKYGYDNVCLLGTHVTYKAKSILRELGKVFGLPRNEIEELVETRKIQDAGRDHINHKVYAYAEYIVKKELPANISIHAGGVLITEKPIYAYTATDVPPKGLPVSHFEMHSAEDFGIYKFDILSQRGLGHIKETVKHVKRNKGIDVDVYQFKAFKEDEKIKDLLRNSKAMGCFYVESPAMRMLLEKLKCDDYLTLVAASSIIRPGVASSGMMKAYIERFRMHRKNIKYESIHPLMDELMGDTYGVMVYQEDVIKVAHHFGGLTLTEADVLRRGMSGKYRSREEFQRVKDKFFENCKDKYPQHITDRVWFEIESFAGYSFAKGHSASYAVESYQSLSLKAYHPLEFMVGVINNFGGFYRTEFYFHEARMNGGHIEAPCVNHSDYLTTIYGTTIYMGFIHIKSLETQIAKHIADERYARGEYKSLDNFMRRTPGLGLEQLRILIRIGAFRFTGKNKQRLLWEGMLFINNTKSKPTNTIDLFDTEPGHYPLPELNRNPQEDAFDEIELLGFSLCNPFELLASSFYGTTTALDLKNQEGKQVHIVGYVVTTKDTRTKKNEAMCFGTFYDVHGEFFDTVHFPDVTMRYPFRGRGFYEIKGKVTEDFGVFTIEVSYMTKLSMIDARAERHFQESDLRGWYPDEVS